MHRTMLYKLLRVVWYKHKPIITQKLVQTYAVNATFSSSDSGALRCASLRSIQYFVHLVKHRGECRQRIYILFGIRTSGYVQSR
jgi:hypothetical protein